MRYIVLLCALVFSFALLISGGSLLYASIHATQADLFLKDWQDREAVQNAQAFDIAKEAAETALQARLWPNGADYSRLGHIYQWEAANLAADQTSQQHALQNALALYQQDTQLRPAWPYPWLQIAVIKLQLAEADAEYESAVEQLRTLGQWRYELQELLFLAGTQHWSNLNGQQRLTLLQTGLDTLKLNQRRAATLGRALDDINSKTLFCILARTQDVATGRLCPQA